MTIGLCKEAVYENTAILLVLFVSSSTVLDHFVRMSLAMIVVRACKSLDASNA